MTSPFWSEWDGRGFDAAISWTIGWIEDTPENEYEALTAVRRLGVVANEVALHRAYVGNVDEDLILDMCDAHGETEAEPGVFVDPNTIVKVTFATVVVQ
jgi:hypothetical protein